MPLSIDCPCIRGDFHAIILMQKKERFFTLFTLSPPCRLQVIEEAVSARFRSVSYLHTRGPGLAGHLSALQHTLMGDLATVRHLLEQCVPPHYRLTQAYLRSCHHCLQSHLGQVSSWDLESGEIFAVLNWVLHIYNRYSRLTNGRD